MENEPMPASPSETKSRLRMFLSRPENPAPSKMFCGDCHLPIPEEHHICWHCGAGRDRAISEQELLRQRAVEAEVVARANSAGQETPIVPPPVPPEFSFERFYRQTPPPAPDKREKKKPRYLLIALLLVLVGLSIFAWYQRKTTVAGIEQLTVWAKDQVSQYQAEERPVKRPSDKVIPVVKHAGTRYASNVVVVVNEPSESVSSAPPLAITVEGQAPLAESVESGSRMWRFAASGRYPRLIRTPISPLRYRVEPRESMAMLLYQVPPTYPVAARAARLEGPVVLRIIIGTDGTVQEVSPLSGDPVLVPAAVEAVRQWRYRPRYVDGAPAEVETDVILQFSLAETSRAQVRAPGSR